MGLQGPDGARFPPGLPRMGWPVIHPASAAKPLEVQPPVREGGFGGASGRGARTRPPPIQPDWPGAGNPPGIRRPETVRAAAMASPPCVPNASDRTDQVGPGGGRRHGARQFGGDLKALLMLCEQRAEKPGIAGM